MTTVIKINLLYSQTALIIAGSGVTLQNVSKQHIHRKCHILSLKSNTWRLIIKSCNRNETKQYTNTWNIIEVSNSTKEHADKSGNHADL